MGAFEVVRQLLPRLKVRVAIEAPCYLHLVSVVDASLVDVTAIHADVHDVCPVLHGRGSEEGQQGNGYTSEVKRVVAAEG
mmetsp:Transcript_21706/g.25680  ORF Transcript_21706/g.25680 Transcript_21706/m.25680 type:complete len:80 (-) Transcript_21706:186-425(-)